MALRWLFRVGAQVACGAILVWLLHRWLPRSADPKDFLGISIALSSFAVAFALIDVAWPLLNRKLDEPLSASSPLRPAQRDRWRTAAAALERDYFSLFVFAIVLKAAIGAIGLSLLQKAVPGASCATVARLGVFLVGVAIPPVIFMPLAYFSVRKAKIEFVHYEEEEAERLKALETLRTATPYNFDADPHFAGYSKVIHPKL